jgi:hypothetical protein
MTKQSEAASSTQPEELCETCNLPEKDLIHHADALADLGREKGIDVSDFDCHDFSQKAKEVHFGRCETPHFLGEPNADSKALTQNMHPQQPDCREWKSEMPTCKHCGYTVAVAQFGDFKGKLVHVITGNWLCALSAEAELAASRTVERPRKEVQRDSGLVSEYAAPGAAASVENTPMEPEGGQVERQQWIAAINKELSSLRESFNKEHRRAEAAEAELARVRARCVTLEAVNANLFMEQHALVEAESALAASQAEAKELAERVTKMFPIAIGCGRCPAVPCFDEGDCAVEEARKGWRIFDETEWQKLNAGAESVLKRGEGRNAETDKH